MARKPRQQSGRAGSSQAAGSVEDRVVDGMMRLLASRTFASVGLGEIAEEAAVSLGELRVAFSGKLAILDAFSKRIDRAVLDGEPAEGDTPRDRVFDVMMRRFDVLEPHKSAVRSVVRAARCDLCLAAFLDRSATRSMKWMLVAAQADRRGILGAVAAKGLVLVGADALRVWLDDDDPGLASTMAALDRGLDRGARAMNLADRICCGLRPKRDRGAETRPAEA